ncbi:GIY-YIG nuclease family protein [Tenacibaculum dicentrarchi]|nr:GIY-YIG nuclease family protein [Tenacibaculum dicentrarchi]MCD8421260.1 GIY-YIG nuclease family protein [Tenacibaculum dicentrarchi]MCD8438276.1 GIY-YIG nuclease family protein [Tenacibaculum dicentrarchi]MCD8452688.1 GIY-YIG nuclease family protein [Tenacibaculum dicentrarchi]MCG8829097.1 GIY-YIG nuclease family protein [Tenacibaculum dicentrarchi]
MNRPQTIQIFLPDGSPRGVKIAEITNRVVKAVLVPRNKLDYISTRDELNNVGIYFLFGESTEKVKPIVYIGEAEDCLERLKQHNRTKEFWNYALVMVSKINAFTKSHAKYLEHIAVEQAKESNRFETENLTAPSKPFVTESMEADLLDSFDTIKILLSTLGFPVFDKIGKEQITSKELLLLNGRNIKAEGDLIDDGFVVFKGSQAKKETVPSCHEYLINLRQKLLLNGIIINKNENYEFIQDYVFNSPSTAGGVVLGRSTNGWTKWKNKEGKTLDELKRK